LEHIPEISRKKSKNDKFKIRLMEEREKFGENCVRGEICIDGFVEIFLRRWYFGGKLTITRAGSINWPS
jgi:hypothetical protein